MVNDFIVVIFGTSKVKQNKTKQEQPQKTFCNTSTQEKTTVCVYFVLRIQLSLQVTMYHKSELPKECVDQVFQLMKGREMKKGNSSQVALFSDV